MDEYTTTAPTQRHSLTTTLIYEESSTTLIYDISYLAIKIPAALLWRLSEISFGTIVGKAEQHQPAIASDGWMDMLDKNCWEHSLTY